ncbi:GDP-D-glucose phosphorylase 1 [Schistocerca gregaria]|uniref:GDP-D-glucose phosphorylase 1 n=1 Tax=Schistocerca gregaria TaxID=7010 RepID=UPI00211E9BF9|nr:GDP-D-glucose phosphorylase 1 [Schistocerca gregaria]
MKYEYCKTDFIYETSRSDSSVQSGSVFDSALQNTWKAALERGVFRYVLNIQHSKILEGKFSFVAQLNTDRALKRRAPEEITSLTQPFDHDRFNFTKIDETEILFELRRKCDTSTNRHCVIINESPLEFGHCLLLPSRLNCLPQIATQHSLQLAIEVMLLSSNPAFRVGFNSLCGYASVNHLHYHGYYLNYSMLLEHISVQHLSGPCFILVNYPAKGFVFQLPSDKRPETLARDVFKLTNFLVCNNVAHNIYITRGTDFSSSHTNSKICNTVRVYVWARKSSSGAKQNDAFNPAICELFGHLSVKTEAAYWSLTEEQVVEVLSDVCEGTFGQVTDSVKELFED